MESENNQHTKVELINRGYQVLGEGEEDDRKLSEGEKENHIAQVFKKAGVAITFIRQNIL